MERYIYRKDDEFGTEIVTIRVGKGGQIQDFMVYEKVIRASSAFVDNALKGPWLETTTRLISLPDFASDTFDRYHRWLLTGNLHSKLELKGILELYKKQEPAIVSSPQLQNTYGRHVELWQLCQLSELGHYLLDTTFMDTINDAILSCMVETRKVPSQFPIRAASEIYKALPVTSLSRSLLSDIAAWTVTGDRLAFYRKCMEKPDIDLCPDFCLDVLVAMAQRFTSTPTSKSPFEDWDTSCKYHSHGDEKPCYREEIKGLDSSQKKRPTPEDGEASAAKRQKLRQNTRAIFDTEEMG
ncbi:hypothetical protein BKA63DRAFT_556737 [Paraphoma chrysanthemicola]|nr:hypothetical protein BKA63DRAFT_556737 [Paraphoma chrysanthemicola]